MNQLNKSFGRFFSSLSIEALGALVIVPLLIFLFDSLKDTQYLTLAVLVPIWALALAGMAVFGIVRHFYQSRHMTYRLASNSRLLVHLATELHRCFETYGSKIVLYRVMPFEISEELFTFNELADANFKSALESYQRDLSTIIVRGRGSEDYWDKTIYGRTGFANLDCASWKKIDRLYSGGFTSDADHTPDTSHIGYEASINSFGLFLIGQLTSDGLNVKRWISGYDFYSLTLSAAVVEFEACLFTKNPHVLEACARRIQNIFDHAQKNGHYHPLSDRMEEAERGKIFGELKNMLCPNANAVRH